MQTWLVVGATVVGTLFIQGLATMFKPFRLKKAPTKPSRGSPQQKIIVYGAHASSFSSLVGDTSPFVTKLETWLKMAGLPYTKALGDMTKAPKGKVPYIEHGSNTVCDSSDIIDYLRETYGDQIKIARCPEDPQLEATATLVQRLLEEEMYWVTVLYFRWLWRDAKNYSIMYKGSYFDLVPAFLRPFCKGLLLNETYESAWRQGAARHSEADIISRLRTDLSALSTTLGDKRYILGDQPYDIDACAFGFLDGCLNCKMEDPLAEIVGEFGNLVEYVNRMRLEYWEKSRT